MLFFDFQSLEIVLNRASEKSLKVVGRRATECGCTAHCIVELEGVAGRLQVLGETRSGLGG